MADEAVHRSKLNEAKNDVKRMLSQTEMLLRPVYIQPKG